MLNADTKEQIPLFELPQPEKPAGKAVHQPKAEATTAPKERETEVAAAEKEQPAPEKEPLKGNEPVKPVERQAKRKEAAKPVLKEKPAKAVPGAVPDGDVRLTANIREDLHLKLKIAAATRRTTIGELIEELVETYL